MLIILYFRLCLLYCTTTKFYNTSNRVYYRGCKNTWIYNMSCFGAFGILLRFFVSYRSMKIWKYEKSKKYYCLSYFRCYSNIYVVTDNVSTFCRVCIEFYKNSFLFSIKPNESYLFNLMRRNMRIFQWQKKTNRNKSNWSRVNNY